MTMNSTTPIRETISMGLPKSWKRTEADGDSPLIPKVKLCGPISLNQRDYDWRGPLKSDVPKYESCVININHKKKPYEPRDFEERFGIIKNPVVEGDALHGDVVYNPKHPWAPSFEWWAEHCPKAVGFSHSIEAKTKLNRTTGREQIEGIVRVESVDLVADPATVKGLFEHVQGIAPMDEGLFSKSNWIGWKFKAHNRGAEIQEHSGNFAWAIREGEVIGFWDGKNGFFVETKEERQALAKK